MTDEPVLRVVGVERRFGDLQVLDGVDLAVDAGTVVAVVGPNGAGKTTLLRTVAGLVPPDAGEIHVADGAGGRRAAYLPQSPRFREEATVAETLSWYASLVDGEAAPEAATERVGLGVVADRRVGALSGGMVRLLGLAQALLGDPPVLVLDEPTSGLDPAMTDHVAGVVGDVAAGRAVLLATHDPALVRVADRVAVLDGGAIVADDAPDALRETYGTETLAETFAAALGTDPTVRAGAREDAP